MLRFDNGFTLYTHAEREINDADEETITHAAWPAFMMEDPIANAYFSRLYRDFPAYQFGIYDPADQLALVGNSVPFAFDLSAADLPDDGWDWVMTKAIADYDAGRAPNMMSAISIAVGQDYAGQGLSRLAVEGMRQIARGRDALVAPVRPNWKSRYPLIPIEQYITWQTPAGAPFDPWLRVHWRLGARILKVCHHSMRIPGTLAQWESWTGLPMPASGQYVIPGALVPVSVDFARDEAVYIEPNVWMLHQIEKGTP